MWCPRNLLLQQLRVEMQRQDVGIPWWIVYSVVGLALVCSHVRFSPPGLDQDQHPAEVSFELNVNQGKKHQLEERQEKAF